MSKQINTDNMHNIRKALGIKRMSSCAVCGAGYYDAEFACCPECLAAIARESMRPCRHCGKTPDECVCSGARVRSLMWYRGDTVKRMMFKFKHNADSLLADLIADLCADMLISQKISRRVDAVVPIPSRPKDKRFKGYGHAELLAKHIAAKLNIPYIEALSRSGAKQQKLLSASQRRREVALNFKRSDRCRQKQGGAVYDRILLVDDITTTGGTLMCCAALLRKAGVRQVVCFTAAKTPRRRPNR